MELVITMHFKYLPFCAAMLAATATLSHAQTPTLPNVTVTASPVIEGNLTDNFGALSTVVSQAQIQDLNAVDLASALRRTPGVTISRFNPVGSFGGDEGGAVYIRGMGASRPGSEIKTYVDGVPFYMATWNHPLLDLLPINGMAKIAVLKGPQPQTVGNTFAAVELSPKRAGKSDGLWVDAQLAAGSFGTVVEQLDLTGRSGDWDYALAQGSAKSDGQRESADGTLNNLMARLGYRINPQWSVNLLALGTDNRARDPGDSVTKAGKGGEFNTRGSLAAVTVEHDHDAVKGSIKFYTNHGQSEQKPGLVTSFAMSGLRWREEVKPWTGGQVVVGLDSETVSGDVSPIGFVSSELKLTSPYVAISHTAALGGGWTVTPSAGVRSYSHSELGSSSAPHAGVVLRSAEQLALRANVSKGINYPGVDVALLSHLIPGLGSTWKSLVAEKMDHREIGVTWTPSNQTSVDLSAFSDQLSGRYVFAFPPAVAMPSFVNLGDYEVRGTELTVRHQVGAGWSLFGGLTSLASTKADLPYAPSSSLSLGVNWQGGPWRASVDAQRQSSMFVLNEARASGAPNLSQVDGFAVVNLRAAYKVPALGQRGEVFVAAENIFDRSYEYRPSYPMPGRSAQVGIHASF